MFQRLIIAALAVTLLSSSATRAADPSSPTAAPRSAVANTWQTLLELGGRGAVQSVSCCRVCRTGQACGDSCISRRYTCRRPRGCACQG